ncbi:hypothetical protein ABW19_dt0209815 [Dactylella cylindrospora]|nr:hypothetical protein ABW19_dt0209815 [Dactylella cylindrospora]
MQIESSHYVGSDSPPDQNIYSVWSDSSASFIHQPPHRGFPDADNLAPSGLENFSTHGATGPLMPEEHNLLGWSSSPPGTHAQTGWNTPMSGPAALDPGDNLFGPSWEASCYQLLYGGDGKSYETDEVFLAPRQNLNSLPPPANPPMDYAPQSGHASNPQDSKHEKQPILRVGETKNRGLDVMPYMAEKGVEVETKKQYSQRKRGKFENKEDQRETADTRKSGACLRCQIQRIRVSQSVSQTQEILMGPARLA